ncbi:MAG: hypothetical protein ACRDYA_17680 [Egibacteraceae bacterium]
MCTITWHATTGVPATRSAPPTCWSSAGRSSTRRASGGPGSPTARAATRDGSPPRRRRASAHAERLAELVDRLSATLDAPGRNDEARRRAVAALLGDGAYEPDGRVALRLGDRVVLWVSARRSRLRWSLSRPVTSSRPAPSPPRRTTQSPSTSSASVTGVAATVITTGVTTTMAATTVGRGADHAVRAATEATLTLPDTQGGPRAAAGALPPLTHTLTHTQDTTGSPHAPRPVEETPGR